MERGRLKKEQLKFASVKEAWEKRKGEFEAKKVWLDRLTGRLTEARATLASRADRCVEKARINGAWACGPTTTRTC